MNEDDPENARQVLIETLENLVIMLAVSLNYRGIGGDGAKRRGNEFHDPLQPRPCPGSAYKTGPL